MTFIISRMQDRQQLQSRWMEEHIFYDLTRASSEWDAASIWHFDAANFRIVLDRCRRWGITIFGIESLPEGNFAGVEISACYEPSGDSESSEWHRRAFSNLLARGCNVFSASYSVPDHLLNAIES